LIFFLTGRKKRKRMVTKKREEGPVQKQREPLGDEVLNDKWGVPENSG